jgi:hypothetical protein
MKDLFYLLCAFLCFSFNAYSQCTVPRHINGPPGSVCASSEITVMSLLGQSNYQWDVSPGGVITSVGGSFFPTAKVMWTTPGAHWVSVNFTDMNGCIASSPGVFNVQVVAAPAAPAITGDFEVCQNTPAGSTGNVYTTAPGKASYQWSVTGGSITSGTGTNTVTVTWAASYPSSRTIAVRYAEAGNACLSATATEEVTILTTGTPALSGNTIACAGTSHIYATDPDKSNYVWTVDGGTITSGGTSSSNTVTILWEGDFFNTVSVRYTESNGCATQTNTVGVLTQPSPTVGGNTAVCLNSAVQIMPGMSRAVLLQQAEHLPMPRQRSHGLRPEINLYLSGIQDAKRRRSERSPFTPLHLLFPEALHRRYPARPSMQHKPACRIINGLYRAAARYRPIIIRHRLPGTQQGQKR